MRELQARLRSGRSIESVAAEAGVDVEWVTRFAAPVLAEQIRVVEATRNATFSRARLGPSALRLGPSVYRNLAAKGLTTPHDELDKGWSTRQIAEGRWLVVFTYASRGRKQKASWELDLRSGEVRATDRLGADLAFVPGAPKPASPTAAPAKPVKVPASAPTELDRANAKRVAEARKAAEAQLADAARRGTKQSVEVVKRATSPKAAAERAKRLREELAAAEALAALDGDELEVVDPEDAPVAEATVEVAPEPADRPVLVTREEAVAEPESSAAPELVREPRPELVLRRTPRAPGTDLDPAASAVAMVREAAEALLSDFASGRLAQEAFEAERALPTWDGSAEADDVEVEEEVAEEEVAEVEDDVVPAATPVPARRRRLTATHPAPVPEPVAEPEPEPEPRPTPRREPLVARAPRPPKPRPSRVLTAAVTPPPAAAPVPTPEPSPEPDLLDFASDRPELVPERRRLRGRRDERVTRTPIDLDDLPPLDPPPAPRAERRGPTFRGDLAAPATANGTAEQPAVDPAPAEPTPARRRRSEPLRAR